jgi:hypothetical protein
MALKKVTELASGITIEYFRITRLNIYETSAFYELEAYLNKDARDSGKEPILKDAGTGFIVYDKSLSDFSPFQQAYDAIKHLDNWTNATDI